jgi:hypothetical protein
VLKKYFKFESEAQRKTAARIREEEKLAATII